MMGNNNIDSLIKQNNLKSDIATCRDSLVFLSNLNTNDFQKNRDEIAQLFYCCCKNYSKNDDFSSLNDILFNAFLNIRILYNEISVCKSSFSSLLYVLSYISDPQINNMPKIIDEKVCKENSLICDVYKIFSIKKDEKYVFPIHTFINVLIEEFKENIQIENDTAKINLLVLGLKIFDRDFESQRKKLEKIINDHNLKFLKYLSDDRNCSRDDDWLTNFKCNGVLELKIECEDKFIYYIRSNNLEYFDSDRHIFYETDKKGNNIAVFKEICIPKNFLFLSFEEFFEKLPEKVFLDFYFSNILKCKNFNICKKYFCAIHENQIILLNSFCHNDKFIICKGNNYETNFLNFSSKILSLYNILNISTADINSLTLGFASNLYILNEFPTDFLNGNISQRDFFKKWCLHVLDVNKIQQCFKLIEKELAYTFHKNSYDSKTIEECFIYPIEFPEEFLLNKDFLGFEPVDIFNLNISYDLIDEKYEYNPIESFDINEDYFDSSIILERNGKQFYFSKSIASKNDFISLNKIMILCENIRNLNEYLLNAAEISKLNSTIVEKIFDYMNLQKELLVNSHYVNISKIVNSICLLRLFNYLSRFDIKTKDKVEDFIKIILKHKKLDFKSIDYSFLEDDNCLFYPEENLDSDPTLKRIFEVYATNHQTRNTAIYAQNILKDKDGKYCFNSKKIDKIEILIDNTLTGTKTKNVLSTIFDIEIEGSKKLSNLHYYICDDKIVKLLDIISLNKITDISIHAFFATNKAVNVINNIREQIKNKKGIDVNFYYDRLIEDVFPDEETKTRIENLFGCKCSDCALVIREFNQPYKSAIKVNSIMPNSCYGIFLRK